MTMMMMMMMMIIIIYVDEALCFPHHEVTDYTSICGMPSLTQFIMCFWIKTSECFKCWNTIYLSCSRAGQ